MEIETKVSPKRDAFGNAKMISTKKLNEEWYCEWNLSPSSYHQTHRKTIRKIEKYIKSMMKELNIGFNVIEEIKVSFEKLQIIWYKLL